MEKHAKMRMVQAKSESKRHEAQKAREEDKLERMKLRAKIKMVRAEFEALWREQDRGCISPLEQLKKEFRGQSPNLTNIEILWEEIDWSTVSQLDKSELIILRRNAKNRQDR